MKAAIDAGVNFVDTAAGYEDGESERVLAQALKGHDEVIVETKYLPYESFAPRAVYNGSAQKLVASAEGSLRRCGVNGSTFSSATGCAPWSPSSVS